MQRTPAILVLAVVPIAGHLLFSAFGFNPTDDGFFLAMSRRLLDGQVPHRDFISLRPALTPVLHVPEVWLGGAHTLLLSRLVVWGELAATAWCWVRLAAGTSAASWRGGGTAVGLALVVLLLNHGITNHAAWPTTDGLLLASAGFLTLVRGDVRWARLGYLLLGLAVLCKQSFAPLVPLAVVVFGHVRQPGRFVFALVPAVLYAIAVGLLGGSGPLLEQMVAHENVAARALSPFTDVGPLALGFVIGFAAIALDAAGGAVQPWMSAALRAGIVAGAATGLASGRFLGTPSSVLFAAATGMSVGCRWAATPRSTCRLGCLALGTAWCVSLSAGYNTPARAAGCLALCVLVLGPEHGGRTTHRARGIALVASLLVIVPAYWQGRTRHLYRDRPRSELTVSLDGVFPGADGLRTSPRTAAMLADLGAVLARTRDRPFAILPDFAAYWVTAPARNPLPLDWAQEGELPTIAIRQQFFTALEARRGRVRLIVQKFRADALAAGLVPFSANGASYAVVGEVRGRWRKVDETEFFEVYE